MNEADTYRTYVLPKLKSAGWEHEYITVQMVLTLGRIVPISDRRAQEKLYLRALMPSVLDTAFKGEL